VASTGTWPNLWGEKSRREKSKKKKYSGHKLNLNNQKLKGIWGKEVEIKRFQTKRVLKKWGCSGGRRQRKRMGAKRVQRLSQKGSWKKKATQGKRKRKRGRAIQSECNEMELH